MDFADVPLVSALGANGRISSVRGSRIEVELANAALDAQRVTVGDLLNISAGAKRLVGIITEVARRRDEVQTTAVVDLLGEVGKKNNDALEFRSGVSVHPQIGDVASLQRVPPPLAVLQGGSPA